MDIAGAKALKRRLGADSGDEPTCGLADVPEGAPPVFHWLGVTNAPPEARSVDADDEPGTAGCRCSAGSV